jgi:hypothetical protein
MALACRFACHAGCEALTLYPMGAILWARRRQVSPTRCGPMKLAAVMIVTGCRCDLVWHCGRNDNGDGKANGATTTAVKSCSILSPPKRGGCNPV